MNKLRKLMMGRDPGDGDSSDSDSGDSGFSGGSGGTYDSYDVDAGADQDADFGSDES